MSVTVDEVFETVSMTLRHNLDIRTVTLGINLKDCMDRSVTGFTDRVKRRIVKMGTEVNRVANELEEKYAIPIINRRVSVTPASILLEPLREDPSSAVALAKTLDDAAKEANIDFIGGYGAHVQKGMTISDELVIDSLPEVLSATDNLCAFINLASTDAGMNMTAIERMGRVVLDIAKRTPDAIGCAKLAVFSNIPEDNPFMAGAHHGLGEGDYSVNVGISGPGVVRSVIEQNPDCDLTSLSEIIKRTVFKITRAGELIGRELAGLMNVPFGIVDLSLAATPATGDSVAEIVEAMGISRMGRPGSTAALALLIDAVKKGGSMASGNVGGLSGTFIPVSEDAGMIRAVQDGALSLDKLEALTAVCSVGMDMFAVPGTIHPEVISAIIADEMAIGVANDKTTSVRIIPVPGKVPGDMVHFGGLLGSAPIMDCQADGPVRFIARRGRMPAPFRSLRN